jgi:hypothetical protein
MKKSQVRPTSKAQAESHRAKTSLLLLRIESHIGINDQLVNCPVLRSYRVPLLYNGSGDS